MNVTVIYGGKSGEHEISLVSAASVARNIDKKHKITLWMREQDSNLQQRVTNPLCYHYTIPP